MRSHVGASSPVMWKVSPTASGRPSRPVKATAKSVLCVIVHRLVPSPCTTTGAPRRIRSRSVQWPLVGIMVRS